MSFPAARINDLTASGDMILPPGVSTVLIGDRPAASVSAPVQGPLFKGPPGLISSGSATVLIGGRPAARVSSGVSGSTPTLTGLVPASTIVVSGEPRVLIGG